MSTIFVQVALNRMLTDHSRCNKEVFVINVQRKKKAIIFIACHLILHYSECLLPLIFPNIISYTFSSTTFLPKAKNLFIFAFFRKFAGSQFNFATFYLLGSSHRNVVVCISQGSHEAFSSPFPPIFTLERPKKSLLNFSLLCTKA